MHTIELYIDEDGWVSGGLYISMVFCSISNYQEYNTGYTGYWYMEFLFFTAFSHEYIFWY
jgi:hypothetical protein